MAVTHNNKSIIMTAAADSITGRFVVKAIIWSEATTAEHTMAVKDGAGDVYFTASVAVAGETVTIYLNPPETFDGIETDVLESGNVYYILE